MRGTGEENNKNGSGSVWKTNGSLYRRKTTIRETVEFLENLGRFYHGIFPAIQASAT